jgi:hypothetical protein
VENFDAQSQVGGCLIDHEFSLIREPTNDSPAAIGKEENTLFFRLLYVGIHVDVRYVEVLIGLGVGYG